MANVTRIKAKDSTSDKKSSDDAEISRKVSIKAKNSENTKLNKAKKDAVKRNSEKREIPTWLKPLWFITTPFRAIGRYFRNSFRELRQVRWPNRATTWKITFSVILYVVIIAVAIMLLDVLLTFLFDKLLGGNN